MRFYKDSFEPMPVPPALAYDPGRKYLYKGTYKQFGQPNIHSPDEQGKIYDGNVSWMDICLDLRHYQ